MTQAHDPETDAIELLQRDHDEIRRLLSELAASPAGTIPAGGHDPRGRRAALAGPETGADPSPPVHTAGPGDAAAGRPDRRGDGQDLGRPDRPERDLTFDSARPGHVARGKVEYEQAKKFVQAFLRGQPPKATIATTLFGDKIQQLRS